MTSWIKNAYIRRFFLPILPVTAVPLEPVVPAVLLEPVVPVMLLEPVEPVMPLEPVEPVMPLEPEELVIEEPLEQIVTEELIEINPYITFIVPTINRNTLEKTLLSIQQQTIPHWNAIVIFDGCSPNELPIDKRFQYISVPKMGSKHKKRNTAGFVRNHGMKLVTTPWIGFVDDDDTISPTYIEHLLEEIEITSDVDLVLFRMIHENKIVPPADCFEIKENLVGISFACKTQLVKDGFLFTQNAVEDYRFIKKIEMAHKRIVLSPYICYFVNDAVYKNKSVDIRHII